MTPRDARKAGASYGISIARASHERNYPTYHAYCQRQRAELNTIPVELHREFWRGYDRAHDAEWARLEEATP